MLIGADEKLYQAIVPNPSIWYAKLLWAQDIALHRVMQLF